LIGAEFDKQDLTIPDRTGFAGQSGQIVLPLLANMHHRKPEIAAYLLPSGQRQQAMGGNGRLVRR
jgi:hypothetical protein